MIREFRLDQSETLRYERIEVVQGSSLQQTAYRLSESSSNLTLSTIEAFPRGIPEEFSFECTFRNRKPTLVPWYLFHVTNHYEHSQLSVTMNTEQHTLDLQLPDAYGNLQTASFYHRELFDHSWHKVMLGVTQQQANLWVDCKQIQGIRGEYSETFESRGHIDSSDGHLFISKTTKTTETVPVSVVDLYRKVNWK